jgi:hypothetical protein
MLFPRIEDLANNHPKLIDTGSPISIPKRATRKDNPIISNSSGDSNGLLSQGIQGVSQTKVLTQDSIQGYEFDKRNHASAAQWE